MPRRSGPRSRVHSVDAVTSAQHERQEGGPVMVYVGVDLHRKSSHVAVLAGDGELLASRRIASRPEEFLRVLGELEPGPVEVAFEATYGWGWFADLLADVGIPAHMAHPLATKAISSARVKNDSVDPRRSPTCSGPISSRRP